VSDPVVVSDHMTPQLIMFVAMYSIMINNVVAMSCRLPSLQEHVHKVDGHFHRGAKPGGAY